MKKNKQTQPKYMKQIKDNEAKVDNCIEVVHELNVALRKLSEEIQTLKMNLATTNKRISDHVTGQEAPEHNHSKVQINKKKKTK